MVISQDNVPSFIPKSKPRMVILGTMVAICARDFEGHRPQKVFYYHNNRNHFWKVLQHLFEPKRDPIKMTVLEKKQFLEKWGIAICNLVHEIEVSNQDKNDPSDTILFKAHKRKKLKFKTANKKLKTILETTPLYFTCRSKTGISKLVEGYFQHNKLNDELAETIWYLPTPTRCNPKARSLLWKDEMQAHGFDFKS